MTKFFKRLAKDESGATAIEYGLIAVGICIAIVLIVPQVGASLEAAFTTVNDGSTR
ncbi:MAG: Flp family type IVb pilin [Methyloligellaceae bacterium]